MVLPAARRHDLRRHFDVLAALRQSMEATSVEVEPGGEVSTIWSARCKMDFHRLVVSIASLETKVEPPHDMGQA